MVHIPLVNLIKLLILAGPGGHIYISALGRQRQEDHDFKASPDKINEALCQKQNRNKVDFSSDGFLLMPDFQPPK
jgi:hypothetical protein